MLDFIQSQILFYLAIIITLFLPGYFLFLAIFGNTKLLIWEKITIWFGLSFSITTFLLILAGKLGFPINPLTISSSVFLFSLICFFIYKNFPREKDKEKTPTFSKNQNILILLLLALTIIIKVIYLTDTIFPTSTDLGHHMYWSKLISQTGELPVYQKQKIVSESGTYTIENPENISDFIIGEHLIFSAINLLSGIPFISYFPSLVLLLINLFGILALFILTYRLFENHPQGKNIAISALLLIGPLYALSSPQAKCVSGGVIGNILGNLLIPLSLYFLYLAVKKNDSRHLFFFVLSFAGLLYTHHLSSFVLIYILAFIFIFYILANLLDFAKLKRNLREWIRLISSLKIMVLFLFFVIFAFFFHMPSYIENTAIETAIGGPSKVTRAGISLIDLKFSAGEARTVLAIFGTVILILTYSLKKYAAAFSIGWLLVIFLMSAKPAWLYLDIPSNRISNYLDYPLSLMGGVGLALLFYQAKKILTYKLFLLFFATILIFVFSNGFQDNSLSLSTGSDPEKSVQTFHSAQYLADTIEKDDILLKDHNYLTSDTWMKLFFMKDYNYPLSRSFFHRYFDPVKEREMCTLWMISQPSSPDGQKCFNDLGVNFLAVSSEMDGTQFENLPFFWKIYESNSVGIYHKTNE